MIPTFIKSYSVSSRFFYFRKISVFDGACFNFFKRAYFNFMIDFMKTNASLLVGEKCPNTEFNRTEYGKIRTRKTLYLDTFQADLDVTKMLFKFYMYVNSIQLTAKY